MAYKIEPVTLDRLLNVDPLEASKHTCYICGFYAYDPRQCTNKDSSSKTCMALFCYQCLRNLLQSKPFCPRCRTPSIKDQFKRPHFEFWRKHQDEIKIKCRFYDQASAACGATTFERLYQHELSCENRLSQCSICLKSRPCAIAQ